MAAWRLPVGSGRSCRVLALVETSGLEPGAARLTDASTRPTTLCSWVRATGAGRRRRWGVGGCGSGCGGGARQCSRRPDGSGTGRPRCARRGSRVRVALVRAGRGRGVCRRRRARPVSGRWRRARPMCGRWRRARPVCGRRRRGCRVCGRRRRVVHGVWSLAAGLPRCVVVWRRGRGRRGGRRFRRFRGGPFGRRDGGHCGLRGDDRRRRAALRRPGVCRRRADVDLDYAVPLAPSESVTRQSPTRSRAAHMSRSRSRQSRSRSRRPVRTTTRTSGSRRRSA